LKNFFAAWCSVGACVATRAAEPSTALAPASWGAAIAVCGPRLDAWRARGRCEAAVDRAWGQRLLLAPCGLRDVVDDDRFHRGTGLASHSSARRPRAK
jgi:hypothetical protein